MKIQISSFFSAFIILLLIGCIPTPPVLVIPTLTSVPTSIPNTVTPTPTNTNTPTLSPTSTFTPTETNTPTLAPTLVPTSTFTPTIEPKVFRGFDKNCIDKKYWYPKPVYSSDKITLDVNNCWNVSSWGIVAENQSLNFSIQDKLFNDRITRSIYTQLSSKVTSIQFKVRVDVLTSAADMDGVFFFGLGNEGNFTKPGLFVKFVTPAKLNRAYLETGPTYMTYWEPKLDYSLGDVLPVKIVINGDYVSIRVNGNEIQGMNLIAANREVLWIGYNSPSENNNLTAVIFDFAIYEK